MDEGGVDERGEVEGEDRGEGFGRGPRGVCGVFPHGEGVDLVAEQVDAVFCAEAHQRREGRARVAPPEWVVRVAQHQGADADPRAGGREERLLVGCYARGAAGVDGPEGHGDHIYPGAHADVGEEGAVVRTSEEDAVAWVGEAPGAVLDGDGDAVRDEDVVGLQCSGGLEVAVHEFGNAGSDGF